MGIHSMESVSVVSKSVPWLICFPSLTGLETVQITIPSTRSAGNKTCLLMSRIRCFTLPFHSNELRVSRSNWDSHSCFLLCTLAELLSGSNVAKALFASAATTVIPQGNTQLFKFGFS